MRRDDRSPRQLLRSAALVAVLVLLLAGCVGPFSGPAGERTDAGSGVVDGEEPDLGAPGTDDGGGQAGPEAPGDGADGGVRRGEVQTRAVILTGQITLTSPDPDEARRQALDVVADLRGHVDSERTEHDNTGMVRVTELRVRVPSVSFDEAMAAFAELGNVRSSNRSGKDVTTELIDVRTRVSVARTSLERLEAFLSEAEEIEDVIRLENAISRRQAELESLLAQQRYLEDQTTLATITLRMSTPPELVEEPENLEDVGFLAGLQAGWRALKIAAVTAATAVGALLPFAVVLAFVLVPLAVLVRTRRSRRTPPAAAAGPDAGAEGSAG